MGNPFDSVTDAVSDSYNSYTGDETDAQQHNQADTAAAREDAQQQRQSLEEQQQDIDVDGYDPPSIDQHDNWDAWSHEQLYGFRDTLKTEEITSSGRAIEQLGGRLRGIFEGMESGARAAAGDGLQGQGAEAAMSAARPVQNWGAAFGGALALTGLKVQEAATTAEQTKASIPPPPEFSTVREVGGEFVSAVTGGEYSDAKLRAQEKAEAAKAARAVVKNVYTPNYESVDKTTPALPPPVNPLEPPVSTRPTPAQLDIPDGKHPGGSGNPGGDGNGGNDGDDSGRPPNREDDNSPPKDRDSDEKDPQRPGGDPDHHPSPDDRGDDDRDGPARNDSAWTDPSPRTPVSPTGPGVTPSTPGAPGSGGGYGAVTGGTPSTAGGGIPRGGQTPSKLGPGGRAGVGATGGTTAPTSSTSTGSTTGRGPAGRMPMGGMGGRNQGSEDEEHERESWLVEHDDVWLNDMPKTPPAVFE